ncbi:hypothetical protein B5F40_10675 [Gordonibacter sp. An230]|nr:hypothetical protein B5F40_10675 [Gordonibacter sp. An230]
MALGARIAAVRLPRIRCASLADPTHVQCEGREGVRLGGVGAYPAKDGGREGRGSEGAGRVA